MPEITFDTEDYYDDETLQDMIESETRCYIRNYVQDMMHKNEYWVPNFITLTAQSIVKDTLAENIPGYKQKIANKLQDIIEGMEDYQIIYSDSFKNIFDECVEECRPFIKSKVESACSENLDANYLIDCVCDEFYNMLSKMLTDD
jgi:hypothetical protein